MGCSTFRDWMLISGRSVSLVYGWRFEETCRRMCCLQNNFGRGCWWKTSCSCSCEWWWKNSLCPHSFDDPFHDCPPPGQKSKVSLAAALWLKPHVIALDEPTNYIDMETLDSLVLALQRFKGGVVCISHSQDFASKVCNEVWHLKDGQVEVEKLKK